MTEKDLNNETVEENSATEEVLVEDVKNDEENERTRIKKMKYNY